VLQPPLRHPPSPSHSQAPHNPCRHPPHMLLPPILPPALLFRTPVSFPTTLSPLVASRVSCLPPTHPPLSSLPPPSR
jgi:hypothetical protein